MKKTIQIEVKDMKEIKWLIESINNYFDELPKELQEIIIAFANRGIGDITADDIYKKYGSDYKFESSLGDKKITKVNEILKTVTYWSETNPEITERVESFWLKINSEKVIEWGSI